MSPYVVPLPTWWHKHGLHTHTYVHTLFLYQHDGTNTVWRALGGCRRQVGHLQQAAHRLHWGIIYVCLYLYMYVSMYVYAHAYIHTYWYTYMHVQPFLWLQAAHGFARVRLCLCHIHTWSDIYRRICEQGTHTRSTMSILQDQPSHTTRSNIAMLQAVPLFTVARFSLQMCNVQHVNECTH